MVRKRLHIAALIAPHPLRDALRKSMVLTHTCMLVSLLLLITCQLAANALVISTSCWWLRPPTSSFTILTFFDATATNVVRSV